jgi:sulfide:quinone oxidoreductase
VDSDRDHVLIAGGGVAALEAALALRELAHDRVTVELLAPEPHFWYRPVAVAEPFGLGNVRRFELSGLAARAGATFTPGELLSVDTARRLAYTSSGAAVSYSKLLIACGAAPREAIEGAITFRGPADTAKIEQLLADIDAGEVRRVAFVVPAGAVWALPAYELALMTAAWLESREIEGVAVSLVTPEDEPLEFFGPEASDAVRRLIEERGIALLTRAHPAEARPGELLLVWDRIVAADRVVALPRLRGPRIGGIPQTFEGFIPVDEHGKVLGLSGVFAAGDITTFPLKQGGIATQLADTAAEAIAAEAGADVVPSPFRPVLRGLLLTGSEPRYLRADLSHDRADDSQASLQPLWWPPAKISGRYLAPFLAELSGTSPAAEPPSVAGQPVEIEIDASVERPRAGMPVADTSWDESELARVGEVMTEPLVVAPEDTLGEVAERMRAGDVGSAVVSEYGRLIGILTSRDMLEAFAARAHPSDARAREWMTAEPIAVPTATPLAAAARLMTENHIHHLPVVEGDRPIGMVGLRQVARAARRFGTGVGLGF